MSTKIASLYAEIGADTSKLQKGLGETKTGLAGVAKGFLSTIGGAAALTGAAAALVKGFKFVVDAAAEAEKVDVQLEAVLKSTAYAAGMTKQELDGLADSLSSMSGIDDELVKKNEAVMLTFTRIGSDVFPQAMQAAMDMSVALGQDLQGSVVMLGKAMNVAAGDTAAASMAMNAMKRVGVAFTTDQVELAKQLIATGNTLEYQKIILEELGTEFGGQAAAVGSTYTGALNRLKIAFGNVGETIGESLLPPLTEAINKVTLFFNTWTLNASIMDTAKYLLEQQGLEVFSLTEHTNGLTVATMDQVNAAKSQAYSMIQAGISVEQLKNKQLAYSYSIDEWKVAAERGIVLVEGYKLAEDGLSIVIDDNTTSVDKNKKANDLLNGAVENNIDTWGFAERALGLYGEKLDDNTWLAEQLAIETGKISSEGLSVRNAVDKLTMAYADGTLTTKDYYYALKAINDEASDGDKTILNLSSSLDLLPREIRTKILIEQYGYKTGVWAPGVRDEYGQLIDMGDAGSFNTNGVSPGKDWVEGNYGSYGGVEKHWYNPKTGEYRANGGPVIIGHSYIVGEKGPEPFVPAQNGTMIPNERLGMGNGDLLNAILNLPSAQDIALAVRDAFLLVSG